GADRRRPWRTLSLARRIDRLRLDRAFVLPGDTRAAFVPWLAGIPVRIGLHPGTRWGLINQPHSALSADGTPLAAGALDRPAVERFVHLAFDPAQPLPGHVPNPVLVRDPGRETAALYRAGLVAETRVAALCVGAEDGPARRWPARHWAGLVTMLAEAQPSLQPVLLGAPSDRDFATEVAALSGGSALNLCGSLSLAHTIALVGRAEAVVAHDCGLMHVAAAFSRPMVAVFGPTDPRYAPPRSPRAKVTWLHQSCSPCKQPVCPLGHGQCLAGVRPESVFESLASTARFATRDIR
ncbi:MAG: lipopolysaccharide heptosyltransferase II, partial [Burkholderiaceae bacterium]